MSDQASGCNERGAEPEHGDLGEMQFSLGWGDRAHVKKVVTIPRGGDPIAAFAAELAAIEQRANGWWSSHLFAVCSKPTTQDMISRGQASDGADARRKGACDRNKSERHRSAESWTGAWAVVLDLDWKDLSTAGKEAHLPLPEDIRLRLEGEARAGRIPCSFFHATPRGIRLVFVFARVCTDVVRFKAAARGARALAAEWLDGCDIAATAGTPGLEIDGSVTEDTARFVWLPRSVVDGKPRANEVIVVRREPFDVENLQGQSAAPAERSETRARGLGRPAAAWPDNGPVPAGSRNSVLASLGGTMRRRGMSFEAIEAALLAENAARCVPPLEPAEVSSIAASIARYPVGDGVADEGSIVIGHEMPVEVTELFAAHKRVLTLFNGTGRPDFDADGRRLGTTPEDYDYGFALKLAQYGIADPSAIATAVALRPDRHAVARGRPYILSRVRAAMAAAGVRPSSSAGAPGGPASGSSAATSFGVERVRVFRADTPRYELHINGRWVAFTTNQLLEMRKFRSRYFEAVLSTPRLPSGNTAPQVWTSIVETWMASAEIIELGADATTDGMLLEAVRRALRELVVGEGIESLDDGKAFELKGKWIFKTAAILRHVAAFIDKPTIEDVSRHLANMGLEIKVRRFKQGKGGTVRAWAMKPPTGSLPPAAPSARPTSPSHAPVPPPPSPHADDMYQPKVLDDPDPRSDDATLDDGSEP